MTTNPENVPFFFIIGRPRSGTTLLRSIFDAHPNVVIPFESPVILNLYRKYKKVRAWDEAAVDELYADLSKQPYFERWRVEKDGLKERIMNRKGEIGFHLLIRLVYQGYQSVFDKSETLWFGDKNPVYSFYADRLFRMFPDAKFIHITRDYRDNLVSLRQVTFEAPIPALIAYRWVRANKLIDKIIRRAPQQVYRLRYEDMAASPEEKTREICDFLGIEFQPGQLEYRKKLEQAKERAAEYQIKNHQSLMKPVNTGRIAIWKEALTPAEVKAMDMVAGRNADQHGYEREYRGRYPLLWLKSLPVLTYARLMNAAMRIGSRLPYKPASWVFLKLQVFYKIYRKLKRKQQEQH
ncbi:MAG TPA: sulfotransferase [Lentimicrobium sp.]|nr:sulfotransferase [Lentimicrobium sp.]